MPEDTRRFDSKIDKLYQSLKTLEKWPTNVHLPICLRWMFAMDETACWMDMPSDTTVEVCGSKCVPLKTTGHEKDHFTVILSARANGKKFKPYSVQRKVNPANERVIKDYWGSGQI